MTQSTKKRVRLTPAEHFSNIVTAVQMAIFVPLSLASLRDTPAMLRWRTWGAAVPHAPKIPLMQYGVYVAGPWSFYATDGEKKWADSTIFVRKAQHVHADYRLRKYALAYAVISAPARPSHRNIVPEQFDPSKSWGAPVGAVGIYGKLDSAVGGMLGYRTVRTQKHALNRTIKSIRRAMKGR